AKAENRMSVTTRGETKGKVRYMAPEQALGFRVDCRADIFSAGAVLWELVSGRPLWPQSLSDRDVFDDLVGGSYATEVAGAEPALNAILKRSLARDASSRYRSADEMRTELLHVLGSEARRTSLGFRAIQLVTELFEAERLRMVNMIAHA